MHKTLKYMFKYKYNFLLIILLMYSLLMVFNSNSIYFIWVFMELNVLMFLTLMVTNSNYVSIMSMKYYLMSSLSSIIFIFFINLNLLNNKFDFILMIINLMMMLKLGIIPFHFWFIDMMINLNWMMCFMLSTVQKIIPFLILSYLYNFNLVFLISIFGGLIGLMLSFNQVLLKKIISYSSINHMFWMLFSLILGMNMWLIYFINYMMINSLIFYLFNKFNLLQMSDLYLMCFNLKLNYNYYLFMMLMSLGGLPPFYGFMLKWYMIIKMMYWMIIFLLLFLIMYSLIFLYFYMRMMYNFMLMNFFKLKFNFKLNLLEMNLKFIYLMNLFCSLNLMMFFFWIFY